MVSAVGKALWGRYNVILHCHDDVMDSFDLKKDVSHRDMAQHHEEGLCQTYHSNPVNPRDEQGFAHPILIQAKLT